MAAQLHDVAGAVVLLVLPGLLVLFDDPGLVFGSGGRADDAGLDLVAHLQLVQIKMLARVDGQRHLAAEPPERLSGLAVDFFVVQIDAVFKVDFGARNMQEAVGIPFGQPGRFARIDHVVRNRRHGGGAFDRRKQSVKRKKFGHFL